MTVAIGKNLRMVCPTCKTVLVRAASEGGVFLKGRCVVLDPGTPRALLTCPGCRARVELRKGQLLLFGGQRPTRATRRA